MNLLIVGGDSTRRLARARAHLGARPAVPLDSATLPFVRPADYGLPPGSTVLLVDVDRTFPNRQTGGTRLVLTQSTYTVQKWLDMLGPAGAIVATADREALRRRAPEAFEARGPWAAFDVVDVTEAAQGAGTERRGRPAEGVRTAPPLVGGPVAPLLARAFASPSAGERVSSCRGVVARAPESPVAHLALASAWREVNDMRSARDELDRALDLAPDWEAAHYEDGKFWLGYDDMSRARDAFERAGARMPSFAAAFSNLGATLGELDEPERALRAFHQALAHDPRGFQVLNNVGVVTRELGRLDESEAALRRVIELAPGFVFGYYNLGHTLFLAEKYDAALAAYEEGQRRDPQKNRRQGCRLAMMRLANGDAAGAERDLWRFANAAPPDERHDLLLEAHEIGAALLAVRPQLATHAALLDRIAAEIRP